MQSAISESTQLERFTRKIQEQYLAVQVEKKTDKDTILENYLNTVGTGTQVNCVQVILYDDAGNQIRKLAAPDSNRLPVTLDQIPVDLQHAVVAIEDERFYEHNGIDVKGILRAGMKALTTGDFSEGASTITQQLLKNNVFTNWTSESTQLERFTRKIQEQYLAFQVEKKTDKYVILK